MKPTDVLRDEHRVIEKVLTCLERMTEAAERDGRLRAAGARDAVSFFRSFADRCHHGKEEAELFPLMESRGFSPDAGPTAVMRAEHVQGRELVGRMAASIEQAGAGRRDALESFTRSARAFVALLRAHIQKEDHCLFPMADRSLTAADQENLKARFSEVDNRDLGPGFHRKFRLLADELAGTCGLAAAAGTAHPRSAGD